MSNVIHLNFQKHSQFFQWQHEIKPPIKNLYAIGNIQLIKTPYKIAIIGSRAISDYGLKILHYIIPELIKNQITIISGGAFGVDYNAQNIALKHNGNNITVLGSGILNPTPKTNSNLFSQISQTGLLLSEEPDFTPATKYSFVKRNRIIAGLADIILIVEARAKSGALITADYALDQGKTVCCFPGRAYDYLAQGTNNLIKQGAFLVDSTEDIIKHLKC